MEQYKVIFIAATLSNKAFSHSVITIDNIVPFITDQDPFIYNITIDNIVPFITDQDPFIYNITIFISHYTVDNFIGIIIDIKASK